jgi:hypothetical protein
MTSDFDSAWKEAFDQYLPALLAVIFPDVAQEIDWSRGYESLEQEFRALHPEGEGGKRLADKIIKVWTRSGDERILHAEAQAQPEPGFERRVYVYGYRSDDRFSIPAEALVILADDSPTWRPTKYEVVLKRTKLTFEFTPVKLLDWRGKEEALRSNANVMALFVLAHLEALRTRGDDTERAAVNLDLDRRLIDRKLDEQDRYQWHKFMDWLLPLPRSRNQTVLEAANEYAKEKKMPYVTSAEEYAREKGIEQGEIKGLLAGRLEALETALQLKFGADGEALMPAFRAINDPERLRVIVQSVKQALALDDVRKLLSPSGGESAQAPP